MPSGGVVSIRRVRGVNFVFVYVACTVCCDETVWCYVTPGRAVCGQCADLLIDHPFSGVRISMHTPTRVIQVMLRGVNRQTVTVSGDAVPSNPAARGTF